MGVEVRLLREDELGEADRIFRLAFGTQLKLPDPMAFWGDAECVRGRWKADPELALAAVDDGRLVGTNFVTCWGSFGFFGPLTVLPKRWNQKVAQALMGPTIELFDRRGCRLTGLYTFSDSAKHVGLYQKFGYWPRFLTMVMSRPPEDRGSKFRVASEADTRECDSIADAVFPGLSVRREIEAVRRQKLGDTVLVDGAFAVCHTGPGSEAGSGTGYVKFAAAAPGRGVEERFGRMLDAVETWAVSRGAASVRAGVNAGREGAYVAMRGRGYKTVLQGVAMHRPSAAGFSHPGAWVLDDWR